MIMAGETSEAASLRAKILDLVAEYAELYHGPKVFEPGVSGVPVSGKVYGAAEMVSLADSALDFWLTTGRFNADFERKLRHY